MSPDTRDVRQRVTIELHRPETGAQEALMLERLSDPALQQSTATGPLVAASASGKAGVQWVRASDVLNGHGTRLADLHASGQENVVKRMRHGMSSQIATSRRGTAHRAVSLPPVGSFGQTRVGVQGQAVGA